MQGFNMRFLLALVCFSILALGQTKLKIMPLGDSITEIICWRATVWNDLVAAGVADKIQFVGSSATNSQNCKSNATDGKFDMHHEGHSGYLAINIANTNLVGWLSSAKPDIVMFMLGTNDVAQGKSVADIIASCTKMVGEMRASNPNMKIIMDLVIPLPSNAKITALNDVIPAWVTATSTAASPIVIADCNTGFPTTDLRDGVHPNAAGDAIIAARVFPPLLTYIKQSLNMSST